MVIRDKKKDLYKSLLENGLLFAQFTTREIFDNYWTYYSYEGDFEFEQFKKLTQSLINLNRNVIRLGVIDTHGYILFDSKELTEGKYRGEKRIPQDKNLLWLAAEAKLNHLETRLEDGERVIEIINPKIEDQGVHLLSVYYYISFREMDKKVRNITLIILVLAVGAFALGIFIAILLARYITHPLSKLNIAAKRMGKGDFDQEVEVKSSDEIGELCQVFNQMAKQVKTLTNTVVKSEKFRTLSKMSTILIHDLKTWASRLSFISQNMRSRIDNPQFMGESLDAIDDTLCRMERLATKLSSMSQKSEMKIEPNDLNMIVREAIEDLNIKSLKKVKLVEEYANLPEVLFDWFNMKKLIYNIALNGLESMPEGGKLMFKTRATEDEAIVEISDTGGGIPMEYIRRHLFKPFMTTKEKGMGLGLYFCKEVIDAHGGKIEVESQMDKGSTFTIKIPLRRLENGDRRDDKNE
ncbi:MAG: ATP-binding protein [Thermodesulfobacteriota bacterium]